MNYLYVFLGGGLGSLARYLFGKGAASWMGGVFPWGTFIANILACGILAGLVVWMGNSGKESSWIQPLLIVGFCGGFSTFSTFGNETYQLLQNDHLLVAILNVLISIVVGVGLIFFIRSKA